MDSSSKDVLIINRVIEPSFFEGKIFYPSLGTKVKFLKLFSKIYPDFFTYFTIGGLMWDRDKFRIIFNNKVLNKEYTLYFKSNLVNRCNGKLCTDGLCLGIHEEINDKYFLKFLVLFGLKMNNFNQTDLLNILAKDHKAKKDYYNLIFSVDIPEYSIMKNWGSPIHDFRFVFIEHKVLDVGYMLTFLIKEIYIHHTERECGQKNPMSSSSNRNLYSFFQEDFDFLIDNYDGYFYLNEKEKKKYKLGEFKYSRYEEFTDLSDDDIIMGYSNDRLEETINKVNKTIENDDEIKVVTYSCSCVPIIIGDNFDIFKNLGKVKVPVIHEGQLSKSNYDMKLHLFYDELKKYFDNGYKSQIDKKSISLFGLFNNDELKSINKILKFNGVKLKSVFVPVFDYKLIPLLFESELFVFTDSVRYNQIYNDTFKVFFKNKGIDLKLPIGIKNTTYWFDKIFSKLDIGYSLDENSREYIEKFNNKKEIVISNDIRVGFVLFGLKDFKIITSPEYSNDIDMLEFIKEMGFGIDFYIVDHVKEKDFEYKFDNYFGDKSIIEDNIKSKLIGYNNHTINFYNNKNLLYSAMKNSNTSLFYSDIYFDDRLIKMGKNSFNIGSFKIGYKGAYDTINEFIKLSNIGYFNKINKYKKYG